MTSAELIALLQRVRKRQLSLFSDLEGEQLFGEQEHHMEPPIWEMGHVAWFQEGFLLRKLDGLAPIMANGDSIYDSFNVSYKLRWDHEFPSKAQTLDYSAEVLEKCVARLESREPTAEEISLYQLSAAHEAMHTENLMAVRQRQGYATPGNGQAQHEVLDYLPRDISVPGGRMQLGAGRDQGFVLDNEGWAHEVEVEPFQICSTAVSNQEYLQFVEAGGYATRSLWNKDDWNWRRRAKVDAPLYWKKEEGGWQQLRFGTWQPLRPWDAMCHLNLHEARAYCRFVGRRLPTEIEWERAASWDERPEHKRLYPWGDQEPSSEHVHMDLASGGPIDVRAKAAGDSALGCRQMVGNVWEWTSSKLKPYPGFEQGAYTEYSLPYFGKKPVLRGGSWATDPWLIRNTWRNFFIKHRRNIYAGLRTCALQ